MLQYIPMVLVCYLGGGDCTRIELAPVSDPKVCAVQIAAMEKKAETFLNIYVREKGCELTYNL